jgi:hypothetical protein
MKPNERHRTSTQNRRMWAMLNDLARQVQWVVNGQLQFLDAEDWKHVMSAGLKKHQRVAAGIEGGFVILGQRTSEYDTKEMADLITIIQAFGDERSVVWTNPKEAALRAQYEQEAA